MRIAIMAVALGALAACGGEAEAPAVEETTAATDTGLAGEVPGFEAVAPGSYEVVHSDGTIDNLTIHPGMTWSSVYASGEAAGGTIFAQDGKNCFVTEGTEGQQCFEGTDPAADGSIEVTGDDGQTATVRPVAGASAESAATDTL